MEEADKERNRLLLVKHAHVHNTRTSSKTHHHLMLAWREQTRRETHYSGQTHTHTPFSKTHSLILAMERAYKERNRSLTVKHYTYIHKTSKTH